MKKTGVNIIFQIVYQVLTIFLPLVTGPILARAFGAEVIGQYQFAYSIAIYFSIFASLGIATLGTREISSCLDDVEKRSDKFWDIYYIKLFLSLICLGIYVLLALVLPGINTYLFLALSLYILGVMLDISWLFFGVEDFKITVLKNILIKLISLVLIIFLIKKQDDVVYYALIIGGANFLSSFVLWFNAKKYIRFRRFNFQRSLHYLKPSLILFLPVVASSVYVYMDKILLGAMASNSQLGYYSSAEKILNLPLAIVEAINTVLFSHAVSLITKGEKEKASLIFNRSLAVVLWFCLGSCVGIIAISDYLVPVYFGDGFEPVSTLMKIGVLFVFLRGIRSVIKMQILLPRKMDRLFNATILVGALVNLCLDLILIPFFGAFGAILGTIISDLASGLMCVIGCKKYIDFKNAFISFLLFGLGSGIMYASIYLFQKFAPLSQLWMLVSSVLVGGAVYLLMTVLAFEFLSKGHLITYFKELKKKG